MSHPMDYAEDHCLGFRRDGNGVLLTFRSCFADSECMPYCSCDCDKCVAAKAKLMKETV